MLPLMRLWAAGVVRIGVNKPSRIIAAQNGPSARFGPLQNAAYHQRLLAVLGPSQRTTRNPVRLVPSRLGVLLQPTVVGVQTAPPRLRGPRPCMANTTRDQTLLGEWGPRSLILRGSGRRPSLRDGPRPSWKRAWRAFEPLRCSGRNPIVRTQSALHRLSCEPPHCSEGALRGPKREPSDGATSMSGQLALAAAGHSI